ncbi:hypothetical protein ACJVDH_14940 [Pedobacter sp. AW1-32]|uniref:hypothetical protein n=1 Tax=Pedobacter sp. AW1-32 TaxID=3383026 RepID=UPI003FEF1565
MKRLVFIFASLIISLCEIKAAEGCRVGNVVYPNFAGYNTLSLSASIPPVIVFGDKVFYNTGGISTEVNACPGYAVVTSTGASCLYGSPTVSLGLGGNNLAVCLNCPSGTIVQYNYFSCDLDDFTWPMIFLTVSIGILMITRNRFAFCYFNP